MSDTDRQEIVAGSEVQFLNKPRDAASILIEGLAGIAVTNGMVKINCFQQLMENDAPGQIFGKFNVILNIPVPQFLAMELVFRQVADELAVEVAPEPTKV